MTFDEWLAKVVEYFSTRYRKDTQDIYSSIDLTDAKCAWRDGAIPETYKIN
jgi:hypothetical protein